MIYEYFKVTKLDKMFYKDYIAPRLPGKILDAHSHMNKPEHVASVPQERIDGDWALQAGYRMTAEDAGYYIDQLFPRIEYGFVAFPFPIKEMDIIANNGYIAELAGAGKIAYGLMATLPDWDIEYLEKELTANSFAGVKPYPDMVSGSKGAEVSIFDFITHQQLALIEKTGKCVMLHLPRTDRFADENNIRELKEIRMKYPNLKMVIAHIGRCFNLSYLEKAVRLLGDAIQGFWFDTAAVSNPEVLGMAMETIPPDRLLYGLDLPIFLWHGKRRWTYDKYFNLCREDFPWNRHEEGLEAESEYTFFIYEQIKNILNQMEKLGLGEDYKRNFFSENGIRLFSGCMANRRRNPE